MRGKRAKFLRRLALSQRTNEDIPLVAYKELKRGQRVRVERVKLSELNNEEKEKLEYTEEYIEGIKEKQNSLDPVVAKPVIYAVIQRILDPGCVRSLYQRLKKADRRNRQHGRVLPIQ